MVEPAKKHEGLRIERVRGEGDLASALAIREIVFIEEQRVPESLERDDEDATAYHVLCYDGGHAIGTGRLIQVAAPPDGEKGTWGRIGRMAVLAKYRHKGVGTRILAALEAEAVRRGFAGVLLHAQVHAREFYHRYSYVDCSEIFDEAHMPHVMMRKRLDPAAVIVPPTASA